eukprot:TRINITY_DN57298_c0_g1_i1.p1 TRINITY_DN57298_c0_g1~~TRINITY_DN57298_c0_g1_i1.p1  ORF type:complete len:343 (+),score=39.60 TRINITY_DN57298_c0_g1_i1:31-1029(+)
MVLSPGDMQFDGARRRPEPQLVGNDAAGVGPIRAIPISGGHSTSSVPSSVASAVSSWFASSTVFDILARNDRGSYLSDCRDERLIVDQEALTQHEQPWAIALIAASALDLLVSGTLAGLAFNYAWRDEGISLYCLALQVLSHLLSSLALVARFIGDLLPDRESSPAGYEVSDVLLLKARRRRDLVREQVIGIAMGCLLLMSTVALLFKALRKLKYWDVWYLDHQERDAEIAHITDMLAWWGFGTYALQCALRFVAARKLRRSTAWQGFVVTLISMLFLLVLGFAASYQREWSWKAEPISAIVLVLLIVVEGARIVCTHLKDVDAVMSHETRA